MLYTQYMISTDNVSPYRELGSSVSDKGLEKFVIDHYSHFCENGGFSKEQMQIHTTPKEFAVGCVNQLYLRERNSYFYLSHIFCADLPQREAMLPLMPNIISTAQFEKIPKRNPDLSATEIPCRSGDIIAISYPQNILTQLVQASMEVLLGSEKRHLFIVSGWSDCFDIKARDLMSQIVYLLPYQCRRRLNFYSYANDITDHEDAPSVVFCRPEDALGFQKLYGDCSYFYFLQQELCFPEVKPAPFAAFAVAHSDQISDLLPYADRKLTGKLKNDLEFYDVLCHFMYVEKDDSLESYSKHRGTLMPNLPQLYQLGVMSRKKMLRLLESELKFKPDDENVPFETKLSTFLYCYKTEIVSKELMQAFLLHIRSCTDPIKWELLCKQLQIPIEPEKEPDTAAVPQETAEQPPAEPILPPQAALQNAPEEAAEAEDADEPEILFQPSGYDLPEEDHAEEEHTEEASPSAEPPSAEQPEDNAAEKDALPAPETLAAPAEMPAEQAADHLEPAPEAEEAAPERALAQIPEEGSLADETLMLPQDVMDLFLQKLMQSADIVRWINAGCLHYNQPLYHDPQVQRAVARYLFSAVSCCETEEEFALVAGVAAQIEEYGEDGLTKTAAETRRLIEQRQNSLALSKEKAQKQEQKQKEDALLEQFDAIFSSTDPSVLHQIDLVPKCVAEHISRARIEEYAVKKHKEEKKPLALLFLCCQYDIDGKLQECPLENVDAYFRTNIRATELKYEWLNALAEMPGMEESEFFNNAICKYALDHPEVLEEAKIHHDALYYFLVKNDLLKTTSRRYFIFGGIIVAAIAAVTAAGILFSSGIFS